MFIAVNGGDSKASGFDDFKFTTLLTGEKRGRTFITAFTISISLILSFMKFRYWIAKKFNIEPQ